MSKKHRRKIAIMVYFEPDQVAKLRAISAKTHAPVAYYVRESIRLFLATQEPAKGRGT